MMRTYKNNGGGHTCLDGTQIRFGETITTEEDLIKKFPNKFTLLHPSELAAPEAVTPAKAPKAAEAAPEAPKVAEAAPEAKTPHIATTAGRKDATAEFPAAAKEGLTVQKDKAGYWVYDGATEPAHEAALKNKAAVTKFLTEYTSKD